MRLEVGEEEEERLCLVCVDIADGRIGQGVDAVAGQLHGLAVVVVEQRVVGVGGELQHVGGQPVLVAAALLRPGTGSASPRCHLPM